MAVTPVRTWRTNAGVLAVCVAVCLLIITGIWHIRKDMVFHEKTRMTLETRSTELQDAKMKTAFLANELSQDRTRKYKIEEYLKQQQVENELLRRDSQDSENCSRELQDAKRQDTFLNSELAKERSHRKQNEQIIAQLQTKNEVLRRDKQACDKMITDEQNRRTAAELSEKRERLQRLDAESRSWSNVWSIVTISNNTQQIIVFELLDENSKWVSQRLDPKYEMRILMNGRECILRYRPAASDAGDKNYTLRSYKVFDHAPTKEDEAFSIRNRFVQRGSEVEIVAE